MLWVWHTGAHRTLESLGAAYGLKRSRASQIIAEQEEILAEEKRVKGKSAIEARRFELFVQMKRTLEEAMAEIAALRALWPAPIDEGRPNE